MARVNNVLRRLPSGWALHVEARRRISNDYPDVIQEPPAAWLIDEERRQLFAESGTKLVSEYFLTLSYLIPEDRSAKASDWLFENKPANPSRRVGEQIATYRETVRQITDLLGSVLPMIEPLDDALTLDKLEAVKPISQNVLVEAPQERIVSRDKQLWHCPIVLGAFVLRISMRIPVSN
ncbi:MAG: hypothetical protein HC871_06205 [Rhizobiales bacterium]|nr:hypothetical protein [Hyphomicrobiales bacterium]